LRKKVERVLSDQDRELLVACFICSTQINGSGISSLIFTRDYLRKTEWLELSLSKCHQKWQVLRHVAVNNKYASL